MKRLLPLLLVMLLGAQPSALADTKISQLGSNASPASSDEIPHNSSGTTKKFTLGTLDTYFSGTTKTLTNKTLNCANNTCTVRAASDVTGTLPIANGGTGQTTAADARNAIFPSATLGQYAYFDGTNWIGASGGGTPNFASLSDYAPTFDGNISQSGSWAFTASTPPSGGTIVAKYTVVRLGAIAILTWRIDTSGVTNIASANPTRLDFDLPGSVTPLEMSSTGTNQLAFPGTGIIVTNSGTLPTGTRAYIKKTGTGTYVVRTECTATTNIYTFAGTVIFPAQ